MSSRDRRAAARRRAWGRGPMILRFEPLEGRQLLSTSTAPLPDLVATSFSSTTTGDWDGAVQVSGTIANVGSAALPNGTVAAIYASPTNAIGGSALLLGTVTINAGLAPGATQPFTTTVALPPSPLTGMGMN
ncbi:MAG TPA: cell adhesion protein, partial [Isosphaeraceae bacterium]